MKKKGQVPPPTICYLPFELGQAGWIMKGIFKELTWHLTSALQDRHHDRTDHENACHRHRHNTWSWPSTSGQKTRPAREGNHVGATTEGMYILKKLWKHPEFHLQHPFRNAKLHAKRKAEPPDFLGLKT